jgi:hypothetical protein
MIIKYEYGYDQLFKMWRKHKEAIDWLKANIADYPAYNSFSETCGFRHAVGQTQEDADNIWLSALQDFRLATGFNDEVMHIKLHHTDGWAVYSVTIAQEIESVSRFFVFIVIQDDTIAVQCRLAIS